LFTIENAPLNFATHSKQLSTSFKKYHRVFALPKLRFNQGRDRSDYEDTLHTFTRDILTSTEQLFATELDAAGFEAEEFFNCEICRNGEPNTDANGVYCQQTAKGNA
jgi:hypothetical protein